MFSWLPCTYTCTCTCVWVLCMRICMCVYVLCIRVVYGCRQLLRPMETTCWRKHSTKTLELVSCLFVTPFLHPSLPSPLSPLPSPLSPLPSPLSLPPLFHPPSSPSLSPSPPPSLTPSLFSPSLPPSPVQLRLRDEFCLQCTPCVVTSPRP